MSSTVCSHVHVFIFLRDLSTCSRCLIFSAETLSPNCKNTWRVSSDGFCLDSPEGSNRSPDLISLSKDHLSDFKNCWSAGLSWWCQLVIVSSQRECNSFIIIIITFIKSSCKNWFSPDCLITDKRHCCRKNLKNISPVKNKQTCCSVSSFTSLIFTQKPSEGKHCGINLHPWSKRQFIKAEQHPIRSTGGSADMWTHSDRPDMGLIYDRRHPEVRLQPNQDCDIILFCVTSGVCCWCVSSHHWAAGSSEHNRFSWRTSRTFSPPRKPA